MVKGKGLGIGLGIGLGLGLGSGNAIPKQQLPSKLYYSVQVDTRQWTMLDSYEGVVRAPLTRQMVQLVISVSPNATGLLPLPTLTLCRCPDDFNLASLSKVSDVELVPMTNAQV